MFYNISVDFGGINYPAPYIEDDKIYIGFVSIFSGCNRALCGKPCPNCQNPSLWYHKVDPSLHPMNLVRLDSFMRNKITRFTSLYDNKRVQYYYTILGGEPIDQDPNELLKVQNTIIQSFPENMNVPTILFSGYNDLKNISKTMKNYIKNNITYLKLGQYLGDKYKKNNLSSGLATENQRWYKVSEMSL